jgi:hypothetical protein
MIAGEGLDPVLVFGRTLAQYLFAQHSNFCHAGSAPVIRGYRPDRSISKLL